MKLPIIDFHCDLLYFLGADPSHTALDPKSRSSLLQLKAGGVVFQTLAIFTSTKKGSSNLGVKQFEAYNKLPLQHSELCTFAPRREAGKIVLAYAIENASSFCEENEPLSVLFDRLKTMKQQRGSPLYISLTWNEENRFGGGNNTKLGLKPDGEALLEYMSEQSICIDLSHTSDPLAFDICNFLEKKSLRCTPIASHSNFRNVVKQNRNLPDEIARLIKNKGGVIGINFVRRFMGASFDTIFEQIQKGVELGLENSMVFGADFFSGLPTLSNLLQSFYPFFHNGYDDASCYPSVISLLEKKIDVSLIQKIAHQNAVKFLVKHNGSVR